MNRPISLTVANYLSIARYTEGNNNVKTELMMSEELSETTKGKDIFNLLDKFFKQNHLDWEKLVGVQPMVLLLCSVESQGFSLCRSYVTKSHFCSLFYTQICSLRQSNATGIIVMLKSNHQDCEFHKSVSAEYAIACKAMRRSWFRLQISSLSHRGALAFTRKYDTASFELKKELLVFFSEKNS